MAYEEDLVLSCIKHIVHSDMPVELKVVAKEALEQMRDREVDALIEKYNGNDLEQSNTHGITANCKTLQPEPPDIIYCKDCIYADQNAWLLSHTAIQKGVFFCTKNHKFLKAADFCSRPKRKTDEQHV